MSGITTCLHFRLHFPGQLSSNLCKLAVNIPQQHTIPRCQRPRADWPHVRREERCRRLTHDMAATSPSPLSSGASSCSPYTATSPRDVKIAVTFIGNSTAIQELFKRVRESLMAGTPAEEGEYEEELPVEGEQ
ncbi:hypothetical protein C8R45DRAFT_1167904 [Mycena sanguinolenta]|nr:hypothetical protein C8R45DRAFT_1167904 [Mycena sanguinolenta]